MCPDDGGPAVAAAFVAGVVVGGGGVGLAVVAWAGGFDEVSYTHFFGWEVFEGGCWRDVEFLFVGRESEEERWWIG
jgi:hypothetical protein